jgi:hypothetical protein
MIAALLTGPDGLIVHPSRAADKISFSRDIRPLLADRCFRCHGPDMAGQESTLRLDLPEQLLADRDGRIAVVPGNPSKSELHRRIHTTDDSERMPPPDSGVTLDGRERQIIDAWILAGAPTSRHWAFEPVNKVEVPAARPGWTDHDGNEIDRFVREQLDENGLEPMPQAERTTLLRRVTLDLTGLPPTPAEVESFLNDQSPDAWERVVDRLLTTPQYGETMALRWLDYARYADSNGFQSDSSRDIWPWRDWVIAAFNANKPFDQFTIEQLAGDLLPDATRDQIVATGFNRNHRLNGEGGLIREEWFVETVIDRVETTGLTWLALTVGCARCHDHKYDPLTQKEFYQLFAFFNSIDETGILAPKGIEGENTPPLLELTTAEQQDELSRREATVAEATARVTKLEEGLRERVAEWVADLRRDLELAEGTGSGEAGPRPIAERPQELIEALRQPQAPNNEEQYELFRKHFIQLQDPALQKAQARLNQATKALNEYRKSIPVTLVMREGERRPAHVLLRGEYDKAGIEVGRDVPSMLPPLPESAPRDRLGLARWMVSESNPLTARVWVNRAWERFFGIGLVKTSDNFGAQAEYPSHPELLDWLAAEFMRPTVLPSVAGQPPHPWDMKALHKLIVMSVAYRRSSAWRRPDASTTIALGDPENRLLARGPRFRLPGEMIRDQALAVSGLLTPTIGGPSVRPYMPEGVWDETNRYGNLRNYKHESGPGLYRRSMYTIWKRTAPPPGMVVFDAPSREVCTIRRSSTNTPLQALSLLNEVTFVEAARKLAERMIVEGGSGERERLTHGFRLTLGRPPTPAEQETLLDGLQADRRHYEGRPESAAALLRVGESASLSGIPPAELAAWTLVGNALLNLDEFVMRE